MIKLSTQAELAVNHFRTCVIFVIVLATVICFGWVARSQTAGDASPGAMVCAYDKSTLNNASVPFTTWRHTGFVLDYPVIRQRIGGADYAKQEMQISRDSSFYKPQRGAITANASTSTAATGVNSVSTLNTIATNLTNLTGGESRQEIKLFVLDAFTTIKHLSGGAGQFKNKSGADIVAVNEDIFTYTRGHINDMWVQM